MATLFSILLAIYVFFYPHESLVPPFFYSISVLMVLTGAIFLLLIPLINVLLFRPIQKSGQHLTGAAVELFRKDRLFQIVNLLVVSFSILSFAFAADPDAIPIVSQISRTLLFAVWIILLGLCIDGTWFILRRALRYISPVAVAQQCFHAGIIGVQENRNEKVWKSMDSLTEVGVHALDRQNLSLTIQSLDHLQELLGSFLKSCKSISRQEEEQGQDQVSYALFYLFQRLELFREKGLQGRSDPVLSHLVTTLAKIIFSCAQTDLSLIIHPLHFIGQLGQKALQQNMDSVADRTMISLVEVTKAIVEEVDLSYAELQPPFLSLFSVMERIAQEMFRKDKMIPIEILTHPFQDLLEIFEHGKIKNHQDQPALKQDLERILADFGNLQTILQTMPSLSPEEKQKRENP